MLDQAGVEDLHLSDLAEALLSSPMVHVTLEIVQREIIEQQYLLCAVGRHEASSQVTMLLGTQFVISSELWLPIRRLYPETILASDRQLDIVKISLGALVGHLSLTRPRHFASLIAVVESLDLGELLGA